MRFWVHLAFGHTHTHRGNEYGASRRSSKSVRFRVAGHSDHQPRFVTQNFLSSLQGRGAFCNTKSHVFSARYFWLKTSDCDYTSYREMDIFEQRLSREDDSRLAVQGLSRIVGFITAFATAHWWTPCRATWISSTTSDSVYLIFVLIFPIYAKVFQVTFFQQVFRQKMLICVLHAYYAVLLDFGP